MLGLSPTGRQNTEKYDGLLEVDIRIARIIPAKALPPIDISSKCDVKADSMRYCAKTESAMMH
jgi:hypothetical protein